MEKYTIDDMSADAAKSDKVDKVAVIIPARYGSTRLCGKPLIKVKDKPIIQWVYEAAKMSKLADIVIIATDDDRIFNAAVAFGADVEMTSANHKCGTDRICEVAKRHPDFKYIINLQGDEPQITPDVIDLAIKSLKNDADCGMSTLIREITDEEQIQSPNCVKCVFDNQNRALYFSRFPIPYKRSDENVKYWGHIGFYAYKREVLFNLASLPQADIEKAESLEQLRALKNGIKIKVAITNLNPVGIDTKQDLDKFIKLCK